MLKIEGTKKTPHVFLNNETGDLEFSGISYPENVELVYEPITEWVENYIKHPQDTTTVTFKLFYFNTATYKYIISLLTSLEKLYLEGKSLKVFWHIDGEDEDLQYLGEDFQDMFDFPFEIVP